MEGLAYSLFYVVAFCALVGGLVLFPRVERKLKFLPQALMNIVLVMCYGSLAAGVCKFVHVPVNLASIGTVYLIPAVGLWFLIARRKKVQELSMEKIEIFSVLLLTVVFLAVELTVFSFEMRASYNYNTDAGNHLAAALSIVRTGEVRGMYFAAFHNAMIVEVFQPFLEEIKYYKAFVFADSLSYYFQILFIYAVMYSFAKKKITKYMVPVLTILCWVGYPLYSYIEGHYVYWGWGAVLVLFMVYEIEQYLEHREDGARLGIALVAGFSGIALCYSLFAPMILWAALFIVIAERKKIKISKKVWIWIGLGILFCALAVIFGYFSFFHNYSRESSIFASLRTPGGCYMNLYSDFIWTIPITLIFSICCFKKQTRLHVYGKVYWSFILFQMITMVAFFAGIISAYYFYKFYYPLWILHWIVIALAIETIEIEKSELKYIYAYGVTLVIVYISCFGAVSERINELGTGWFTEENTIGNSLYSRNMATLQSDFAEMKYSTAQFEICEFVMENLRDTGVNVPFAGWKDCMGQGNWYSAITGMQNNLTYRMVEAEGEDWKKLLESEKMSYYVILKTSDLYKENQNYFETKNWIFENEEGFIVEN